VEQHVLAIKNHPALDASRTAPGLTWIAVDPAGSQRNDQTGVSPIGLMTRHGLRVRTRRARIEHGLRIIRSRLVSSIATESGGGGSDAGGEEVAGIDGERPLLTIDPRGRVLIDAIRAYRYESARGDGRAASTNPRKDGPDRAVDALRYMLTVLDTTSRVKVWQ
jgi:hypothetical protein